MPDVSRVIWKRLIWNNIYVFVHVCVCVCVFVYVCVHERMYLYTHTHTHTHEVFTKTDCFTKPCKFLNILDRIYVWIVRLGVNYKQGTTNDDYVIKFAEKEDNYLPTAMILYSLHRRIFRTRVCYYIRNARHLEIKLLKIDLCVTTLSDHGY